MAHYVTCVYCGERFDRDRILTRKVAERRYAHEECAKKYGQEKTQEEKDLEALEKYIMKLFNEPYINAQIRKQIRDYRKEYNYTYTGILKTLIYWYEVKKNVIEEEHYGLAIVPYIYNQAMQYYYNLFLIQKMNKDKNIKDYKPKVVNVKIRPPRARRKKNKLFNF